MSQQYFENPKVKFSLNDKFNYLHVKFLVLKVADYKIRITFGKFLNKIYPKLILKELINYTFASFKTSNIGPISAELTIKDDDNITLAAKQNKLYVHLSDIHSNTKIKTYYHISFNYFYLVLSELLHYLIRTDGFLLHASSIKINNAAILFIAPSGTGKSTIMKTLSSIFQPLGDDSAIIRKYKNKYYIYQTPFIEKEAWIKKNNARINLGKIYFIKQGKNMRASNLSKEMILKKLELFSPDRMQKDNQMINSMVEFVNKSDINLFQELEVPLNKKKVVAFFQKQYDAK